MIVLIDNYDSFSYNLYQLIGELNPDIKVYRNNEITIEQLIDLKPSHIVLSPGPGRPEDAGICTEIVREFKGRIPLLGVCLGHQAICQVYGANITYAKKLMHGKTSNIAIKNKGIFQGLDKEIIVGRYHSLVALADTIPEELEVIARSIEGEVMAVAHKNDFVFGIQFHPESILTPDGRQIIKNFIEGEYHD